MATELDANVKTAKRAAMLHDVGKAVTHEIEGSHAQISTQYAKRYGEAPGVVHAVEAHHYEVQPQTVEAVLLIAADAISGAPPGSAGRQPRELHQAPGGARGARCEEERRREGLRAPGGSGDPRHRQAGRDRRRPGGAALARDRARHRAGARVPGPDQGHGDPRVAGNRVRQVVPRALVLGGTGLVGRAIARRFLADGWQVDLTGRNHANMPTDVAEAGGRFLSADRCDVERTPLRARQRRRPARGLHLLHGHGRERVAAAPARNRVDGDDLEQSGVRR